jgi:hypothetical protein
MNKPTTIVDWRETRATAALQDAAVYMATLEQLAELEACAAGDTQVLADAYFAARPSQATPERSET